MFLLLLLCINYLYFILQSPSQFNWDLNRYYTAILTGFFPLIVLIVSLKLKSNITINNSLNCLFTVINDILLHTVPHVFDMPETFNINIQCIVLFCNKKQSIFTEYFFVLTKRNMFMRFMFVLFDIHHRISSTGYESGLRQKLLKYLYKSNLK